MKFLNYKFLFLVTLALTLLIFGDFVLAFEKDGTVNGSAWSKNMGWINFGTTGGNIHVTDSELTGNAWNKYFGWLKLNPANSGVKNDAEGNLTGYAWGKNIGWVNFSGVTIDSTGRFLGTATGTNIGEINFSCADCIVTTDWIKLSRRIYCGDGTCNNVETCLTCPVDCGVCHGGGGGGGGGGGIEYSFLINNGNPYTNKKEVHLKFVAGNDTKKMIISESPNFLNAKIEDYEDEIDWKVSNLDGQKNIYVRLFDDYNKELKAFLSSIILDTSDPEITVDGLKENYSLTEEIIFGGTTENNATVNLVLDNDYGNFQADGNGEWFITLGKLSEGKHRVEIYAKDLAGNIGKTFSFNFFVGEKKKEQEQEEGSRENGFFFPIIKKIREGLQPLIPNLVPLTLTPTAQTQIFQKIREGLGFLLPQIITGQKYLAKKTPTPIVMVPKIPQFALNGKWNVFPSEPIRKFVLSPLPRDIAMLAQKFPEIKKTFNEVGVQKITDVSKIQNSNLNLPNLTQSLGLSKVEISPGKFIIAKGISVSELSTLAKQQIPSDVVFVKDDSGLVDFNVALSINSKGQAEQKIRTITNKPLQLVIKIEKPARKVTGMLVFRSRNNSSVTLNNEVSSNAFTASLLFNTPNFKKPAELALGIPIEGSGFIENNQEINTEVINNNIEKRLVLLEFEYKNTGDGVYTATVMAPVVDGEYEVITKVDYIDPEIKSEEIRLITLVDPEGYIYEKLGDKETRILGAVASIYWLNPLTKQYELWAAKDFQQENPQTTDVRGAYSFLVPEGYYYLKVDAPGYLSYDGKPFEVKEGSGVHINIELKTKYWWLKIVDWKTLLLIIVILMLVYNFYKDKKREMQR